MAAPVAAAPAAAPAPVTNGAAPATADGASPAPAPVAKPPEPYRFKRELKVGGKVHAVDLDEAGITRELQVGRHSQAQLEAARAQLDGQAQFDRLLSSGRVDEALAMKGVDIRALIAANAQKAEQRAQMTPEQARIAELEEQLSQTEQRQQTEQAERQAQAKQARLQNVRNETRTDLFAALDAGGFKLGPNVSKQVRGAALAAAARIQAAAIRAKQPPLTPEALVSAIHKHFFSEQQRTTAALLESPDFRGRHGQELSTHFGALTNGLEGDALLSFCGNAFEQRFVAAQMARLAGAGTGGSQAALTPNDATPPPAPQTPGAAPKPMDYWEMQNEMQRRRGGGR